MTVDIARLDHNAVVALNGANDALTRLGEWVQAASHARALVAPLVETAFIPDAYQPKVDPRATPEQKRVAWETAVANATAAVLQGITLGLDPMTALQQIYIVHGRPGMYSEMKVALVVSRGHEVWTEDLTDTRAVVCGRRKGTEYTERVTVTMDQARKAGWSAKNDNYTKNPQDMLYARAAGRVCDRIAPDVLMGIASVEEIKDTIQTTAEVGNGTRTVTPRKRAAPPALEAADDPPLEETPEPVETPSEPQEPAETVRTITAAQSRKLHAMLNERGRKDRDVALVWIAGVIGREITSTKELTVAEAAGVIDVLDTEGDPDPDAPPLLDVGEAS